MLSTLKPIHVKTVSEVYGHLKSDKGKQVILNEFRGIGIAEAIKKGITEAIKKMRENPKSGLKPYWIDYWVDFVVFKKRKYCCVRNKAIVVL